MTSPAGNDYPAGLSATPATCERPSAFYECQPWPINCNCWESLHRRPQVSLDVRASSPVGRSFGRNGKERVSFDSRKAVIGPVHVACCAPEFRWYRLSRVATDAEYELTETSCQRRLETDPRGAASGAPPRHQPCIRATTWAESQALHRKVPSDHGYRTPVTRLIRPQTFASDSFQLPAHCVTSNSASDCSPR
jgi:hypothetical protein